MSLAENEDISTSLRVLSPLCLWARKHEIMYLQSIQLQKNYYKVDTNTHPLISKFNNYLCQWFHWPNIRIRTKENMFKLCLFLIHSLNRQLLWRIIFVCGFWLFLFWGIVLIKKSLKLTKKSNLNNLPRGKLKCIWTHAIGFLFNDKLISQVDF